MCLVVVTGQTLAELETGQLIRDFSQFFFSLFFSFGSIFYRWKIKNKINLEFFRGFMFQYCNFEEKEARLCFKKIWLFNF